MFEPHNRPWKNAAACCTLHPNLRNKHEVYLSSPLTLFKGLPTLPSPPTPWLTKRFNDGGYCVDVPFSERRCFTPSEQEDNVIYVEYQSGLSFCFFNSSEKQRLCAAENSSPSNQQMDFDGTFPRSRRFRPRSVPYRRFRAKN